MGQRLGRRVQWPPPQASPTTKGTKKSRGKKKKKKMEFLGIGSPLFYVFFCFYNLVVLIWADFNHPTTKERNKDKRLGGLELCSPNRLHNFEF
jgi:hypothetical protein